MMRIGIQRRKYPEVRNILALNRDTVEYTMEALDHTTLPKFLTESISTVRHLRANSSAPVKTADIDCYHYFNTIPLTDVPFVTTFETSLPRWWGAPRDIWDFGLRQLRADNCKRLFAISQNAALINGITTNDPVIAGKTEVLLPAQPVVCSNLSKFECMDTLLVSLVGRDFLRKGGLELVRAFDRLLRAGFRAHLCIVSPLNVVDRTQFWSVRADAELADVRDMIAARPDGFTLIEELPNDRVLQLLAQSHVAALPSYRDTFGYAVLEAQACACPVITTNQRAFPEINDEACGWVIALPLDHLGRVGAADFDGQRRTLEDGIYAALVEAATRPKELKAKAERCLARIEREHGIASRSARVLEAYGACG